MSVSPSHPLPTRPPVVLRVVGGPDRPGHPVPTWPARLSPRETEVLLCVARGMSNAEIAAELFISLATVKSHVARLLTKVRARDRVQLVVVAYRSGFVHVH